MPAKKAAKKAAKKSAHHHEHKHGKDVLRAYEHLGRIHALEPILPATVVSQIRTLGDLAQASLSSADAKSAADLLRASEHIAFGSLAATSNAKRLSDDLEGAANAEYEQLTDKADEHWQRHADERPAGIEVIYDGMLEAASVAFNKGAYRRALEFARGAEALAHVHGDGQWTLGDGGTGAKQKTLRS